MENIFLPIAIYESADISKFLLILCSSIFKIWATEHLPYKTVGTMYL